MTDRSVSHRARFAAGLGVGLALVLVAEYVLLSGARRANEQARFERTAVVSLRALSEVVQAARGSGPAVREAVGVWGRNHPEVTAIRVIAFDGISLEASTAASDIGQNAPPRRLARDEKPLFDQGQRLRAAIETNRQEGAARKDEIESEKLASRAWRVAAPVEIDGSVAGMVQIETAPPPPLQPPSLLVLFVCIVAPLLLFAGLARFIGQRRWPLAAAAFAIAALALLVVGSYSLGVLRDDLRATEERVGQSVVREVGLARKLVTPPSPTAIDPGSWDCDSFRRPRKIVGATGILDRVRVNEEIGSAIRPARRALVALALTSLALLAFIGFGGAAVLRRTLVVNREAYSYSFPAMLGMIVLVFFPFLYGIALSFTDQNIYNTNKPLTEIWVGFRNYIDILGDFSIAKRAAGGALVFNYLNFYWTFLFTVVWTVCNVTFGVTMGLVLALILNTKGLALRPAYRVLLILPWAMPNYITALIWKGMFHQQFGVINQFIQMFHGTAVSWFERPFTAFCTVLTTNGWLSFPFMMVISLGALQSIPAELYEAARVDGANRWQQFRAITLPSIKPALVPAVILSVVWTFNMFNIIYLVTQGEPASSTEILITQSYKFAFEKYRYGYAAAYSTVIFAILLIYGSIQNRATRATESL